MRKIVFGMLALTITSASMAQDKQETIVPSGNIVTREVPVKSFDALQASGIYELKLSQGNTESVKIEADDNIQDFFSVTNEGSKLVINMEKMKNKNINGNGERRKNLRWTVYVTFKKLKDLDLKTVGGVSSQEALAFDDLQVNNKSVGSIDLNLTANKLDFNNSSVGTVKLSGKAQEAVVKNSGVGSLHAGSFVVQTMNIDNSGIGSAEVNAEKTLKVRDNGMGKVHNKGAATVRRMNKVVI